MTFLPPLTRETKLHLSQATLGLGLGIYLAATGLIIGAMSMTALPVRAATDELCMSQGECIDLKIAKGGNCDAKHCYESGHGCLSGQGYCYAKWASTELSVNIGGVAKVSDLGDYIVKFYDWGFGIAAVLAAIMMMVGGFMYVSSGGNSAMVGKGKKRIMDAAIGLLIAISAYTILQTVNPDLVRFRLPKFPTIKRSFLAQCERFRICYPCGSKFYLMIPKGADAAKMNEGGATSVDKATCKKYATLNKDSVDTSKYEVSSECFGGSCSQVTSSCGDGTSKCVQGAPGEAPEDNCTPKDVSLGGLAAADCKTAFDTCISNTRGVNGESVDKDGEAEKACIAAQTECQKKSGATTETTSATEKPEVSSTGITNGYYCKVCAGEGQPCPGGGRVGTNAGCCGGKCVSARGSATSTAVNSLGGAGVNNDSSLMGDFICSAGDVGAPCGQNADCTSSAGPGYCFTSVIYGGFCTTGLLGSPCTNGGECASGLVCARPLDSAIMANIVGGVCSNKADYSVCGGPADCNSGKCLKGTCVPASGEIKTCTSGALIGSSCPPEASHCPSSTNSNPDQSTTSAVGSTFAQKGGAIFGTGWTAEFVTNQLKGIVGTADILASAACDVGAMAAAASCIQTAGFATTDTCKSLYEKVLGMDTSCWDGVNLTGDSNICTPGTPGAPCVSSTDCDMNSTRGCGNGVCTTGSAGTRCDQGLALSCAVGYKCVKFPATQPQWFCVTGKEGSPCMNGDEDCDNGYKCQKNAGAERGTCAAK